MARTAEVRFGDQAAGATAQMGAIAGHAGRFRNRILDALQPAEMKRLAPALEWLDPRPGERLMERGDPMRFAYFPETGAASLVWLLSDGWTVEAGVIGHDGVIGVSAWLGKVHSPFDVIWLVPGQTLRLPIEIFKDELQRGGRLEERVRHYTQALMVQIVQSVACNRRHTVEQRLARWLLEVSDRVEADKVEFRLTHQFLGSMLGVERPTVTVAATRLARDGAIHYRRGVLEVRDRGTLEANVCECYESIKREFSWADAPWDVSAV